MCYSTDDKVNPKTEVTYEENFPYGTNGYRTDCNYIPVIYYASYISPVLGCNVIQVISTTTDNFATVLPMNELKLLGRQILMLW